MDTIAKKGDPVLDPIQLTAYWGRQAITQVVTIKGCDGEGWRPGSDLRERGLKLVSDHQEGRLKEVVFRRTAEGQVALSQTEKEGWGGKFR